MCTDPPPVNSLVTGVPEGAPEPRERAVREELSRILKSGPFARSARLSRFLTFSVEASLRGESERVKEYTVGAEAFGRGASFDPRVDPVVRVEARRLRSRLKAWYEGEGRGSPVVIELPRGGYAAVFHDRAEPSLDVASAAPTGQRTIAVLPFTNLNSGADGDYLSDGLTEELIHSLTKLSGLRVVAWQSASRLRGHEQDIEEIRKRLGVESVLRGSVRCSGDRLRITAQLIDAASGYYLWSEAWDRNASDVFAIEEEIARAIVDTLRVHMGDRTIHRLTPAPANLECHKLYLKGRLHWNKRTTDGLHTAIGCFEQAVAIDAGFALGWAGLADSYAVLADYGLMAQAASIPAASRAANRAMELDPSLAEPYVSLGLFRARYEWNWDESERLFRKAIELNPGYATAHHWYSVDVLAMRGRMDEALEEIETAISLDPLSPILREGRAYLMTLSHRYGEAMEQLKALREMDPTFHKAWTSMGRVYTLLGDYAAAITMYQKGRSIAGDVPSLLGALGQAYALGGRTDDAKELLSQLLEMARHRHVSSTAFAILHLGLGEQGRALDWLETGVEQRDLSMGPLNVHPIYDAIRGEPRFQAVLRRMRLID